ncbi:DUF4190 domain-containing protein [Bifidobacterium vespertilionis]|uniref:DUF4190 domain-containing protein n=2 Tax=Bifidobacterium vespertilionis TaxID=2562524 RepID=A0A5J5E4J8_9BIFI|nr:DUF4190 domain-containing protein [Bifidobacterium vespertilionis]KAA8823967.1 DUF4190 domain-containing protein [Bifidobacterium vespertilionis]
MYGAYAPQPGQPGYQPGPQPVYPGYAGYYPPMQRWNVMSIVGFILSFVIPPAGLVVSIIALLQINKSGEKSKGLAIAGIAVGAVCTVLIVLFIALFVYALGYAMQNGYYYDGPRGYGYGDIMDSGALQGLTTQYVSSAVALVA